MKKETGSKKMLSARIIAVLLAVFMLPAQAKAESEIYLGMSGQAVSEITVPKGEDFFLDLYSDDDSVQNEIWDNSDEIEMVVKDENIVEKDERSFVAKKAGKTEVTFTYKEEQYTCKITVVPKYKIKILSAKTNKKGNTTFKVKNNMKKTVTFYSEGALRDWVSADEGGVEPVKLKKSKIKIGAGKTVSIVIKSYGDPVLLRTEYDGQKFTYCLANDSMIAGWHLPVWY